MLRNLNYHMDINKDTKIRNLSFVEVLKSQSLKKKTKAETSLQ